jgi:hypothetical protein
LTHSESLKVFPQGLRTLLTEILSPAAFGFLLSFYTNPWIEQNGYNGAFGAMAGISAAIIILWIPLYVWGRQIRIATLKWTVIQGLIKWDKDRESGE